MKTKNLLLFLVFLAFLGISASGQLHNISKSNFPKHNDTNFNNWQKPDSLGPISKDSLSIHKPDPLKPIAPDSAIKNNHDSLQFWPKGSFHGKNHKPDSLIFSKNDSLSKHNHDTLKIHKPDSLDFRHIDSAFFKNHKPDSLIFYKNDSLNKFNHDSLKVHDRDSLHYINKDSLHFKNNLPDSAVLAHLDSIFKNLPDSFKFIGIKGVGENIFQNIGNKFGKPDSFVWIGLGKDSILVKGIDSLPQFVIDSLLLLKPGNIKTNITDSIKNSNSTTSTTSGNSASEATSVSGLNENKFNMYPNPASDYIFLESSGIISRYEIYSYNGKLLSANSVNANQYSILLSGINSGIYILKVYTSSGIVNKSFVVTKQLR